MCWQRIKQTTDNTEFFLGSKLVLGTKMSCLSGTNRRNLIKLKTSDELNNLAPTSNRSGIFWSQGVHQTEDIHELKGS